MFAYELMNEAVADDTEDWNKLLAKCFSVEKEMEPERLIVIDSNRWQSTTTFNELKVPDDNNIILSYHFYESFCGLITMHPGPHFRIIPGRCIAMG